MTGNAMLAPRLVVLVIEEVGGEAFAGRAGFLIRTGDAAIVVVVVYKLQNRFHLRMAFELEAGHHLRRAPVFGMTGCLGA